MDARVVYVSSEASRAAADLLPSNIGRSSLVHSLIDAFDLLQTDPNEQSEDTVPSEDVPKSTKARVLAPVSATKRDLTRFHDEELVGHHLLI